MNKIFKVVWSKVRNAYVVVSEIAKNTVSGVGKRNRVKRFSMGATLAAVVLTSSFFLPSEGLAADSALIDAYEYNYIAVAGSYNVNPFGNNNDIKVENGERYVNVNINGTTYKYVYTLVDKDGVFDNNSNDDVGYWIRDGFGVKAITERYHPTATDVRLDLYKIPGTNANYDYISMSGAHTAEPTKITTANNGEALDEFSYIQYAAITNSGGINTPSEWEYYVMQNEKYVNVGGNNFNNNFYEFKATEFNATTGKYTFKGKDVEYENVYRVGNKIGVFLTKAANNASTAKSSYDINAEVYGGSVFGKNNEILLSGYDAKTNTWSTVWAGEVTDPYATVESMTLSEFNEILHHLHKENVKLANADIVGIKAGGNKNSGTLNLLNKANNLSNGLTINSVGGTGGSDTRLVFTASGNYVDNEGATQNYNNSFTLDTGSKVVANNGQAYTTNQKLEKLTINGNTYLVSGSTGGGTTTVSNITLTAGNNISISGTTENGTTNYTVTATDTDTTYKIVAEVPDSNGRTQYTLMDVSKNSSEGIFYDTNTDTNTLYAVSDGVYNSASGETAYTFSGDNGFNKTIIDKNNYVTGATVQNGNLVLERLGLSDIAVSLADLKHGLSLSDAKLVSNPLGGTYVVDSTGKVTLKVSDGITTNDVVISGIATKSAVDAAKTEVVGNGDVTVTSGIGSKGQTIYTVSATDDNTTYNVSETTQGLSAGQVKKYTITGSDGVAKTIFDTDTNTTYNVSETTQGLSAGQVKKYTITGSNGVSAGTIIDTNTVTNLVAGSNVTIGTPTVDNQGNRTYTVSAEDTTLERVEHSTGSLGGTKFTIYDTSENSVVIDNVATINDISSYSIAARVYNGNNSIELLKDNNTVAGTIAISSTGGSGGHDVFVNFSNIDASGTVNSAFDVLTGSKVSPIVSSDGTNTLAGLVINGHNYNLFTASGVVSSNNINIHDEDAIKKDNKVYGWHIVDTNQKGTNGNLLIFEDTTLLNGNVTPVSDGNNGYKYEIYDTAGNKVTLSGIASASQVNTNTQSINNILAGDAYGISTRKVTSGGITENYIDLLKSDGGIDSSVKIVGSGGNGTDRNINFGTGNHMITIETGSVVRATEVTGGVLTKLTINGAPYELINSAYVASLNNLTVSGGSGRLAYNSVSANDNEKHGWVLQDNKQSGVTYVDTVLVSGNAHPTNVTNSGRTYTIYDTAGNAVVLNDVASASQVATNTTNISTLSSKIDAINQNNSDWRLVGAEVTDSTTNETTYTGDYAVNNGQVTLNVQDKIKGGIETVTITNLASASQVEANTVKINSISNNVNNISTQIQDIYDTNSDWRLVGAAVTDSTTNETTYTGAYAVDNNGRINLNIQNQIGNGIATVTINDVAKASDIGDMTTIKGNLNSGVENTVVNHISNLYHQVSMGATKEVSVDSVDGNINVVSVQSKSGGTSYGLSLASNVHVGSSVTVGANHSSSTNIVLDGTDASILSHSVTADVIEARHHFDVGDVRINSSEITGLDNTEWDSSVTYTGGKAATQEQLQVVDGKVKNVEAHIGNLYLNDEYFAKNNKHLDSRINQLGSKVNKVGAGAAALAALHPMDFDPDDKLSFAVGAGNYAGETATALGAFYRPNEKVMMNVAGTYGNGENMVNMGVSFALDRTNHVSNSRTAMAKEIVDLREQVATQGQQIAQLVALVQQLAGVQQPVVPADQLFPDVPENHWAYEYVNTLVSKGIIEGYPDGTFGGDRTMTRYEFAAMLFRAMEQGVVLSEQIRQEFEKELGRVRVDRVKGADNDPNKIERVRVNKAADRDNYGSKIVQVKH